MTKHEVEVEVEVRDEQEEMIMGYHGFLALLNSKDISLWLGTVI